MFCMRTSQTCCNDSSAKHTFVPKSSHYNTQSTDQLHPVYLQMLGCRQVNMPVLVIGWCDRAASDVERCFGIRSAAQAQRRFWIMPFSGASVLSFLHNAVLHRREQLLHALLQRPSDADADADEARPDTCSWQQLAAVTQLLTETRQMSWRRCQNRPNVKL